MKSVPSVGLLYDSISSNTGDVAIGIALKQAFFARGVDADIIDPFRATTSQYKTVIVGGGQLLRDPGDEFYDTFRLQGKHILNSVGVSGERDFGYLDEYAYLSARSTDEAAVLQKQLQQKVKILPCTTTVLKSDRYDIEGLDLQPGEKVVGIHLVPDVLIRCPDLIQIINSIPHKKVLIPFTHYNEDASFMASLPIDKSNAIMLGKLDPLELHSVISQMDYVIVSSLHASIFAYSQNVPFISMHQDKTLSYFKDRSLGKYVYQTQEELQKLISEIEVHPPEMKGSIRRDKKRVNDAIDLFVELTKNNISRADMTAEASPSDVTAELHKLTIGNKQLKMVVEKRDVLMHNLIYQGIRSNQAQYAQLSSKIEELQKEIETLETFKGYVRRTLDRRGRKSTSVGKK
jgi:hypothetical protein